MGARALTGRKSILARPFGSCLDQLIEAQHIRELYIVYCSHALCALNYQLIPQTIKVYIAYNDESTHSGGKSLINQITLSVIAFHDEGKWIAQCVEYDIAASAESLTKLRKAFEKAVIANICVNKELGHSGLDGIPSAPSKFRDLFNNADTGLYAVKPTPSRAHVEIRDFR